jgi:hypothetical protein
MTVVCDTQSLIDAKQVLSVYYGLGVLYEELATEGEQGDSPLLDDGGSPGDEIRWGPATVTSGDLEVEIGERGDFQSINSGSFSYLWWKNGVLQDTGHVIVQYPSYNIESLVYAEAEVSSSFSNNITDSLGITMTTSGIADSSLALSILDTIGSSISPSTRTAINALSSYYEEIAGTISVSTLMSPLAEAIIGTIQSSISEYLASSISVSAETQTSIVTDFYEELLAGDPTSSLITPSTIALTELLNAILDVSGSMFNLSVSANTNFITDFYSDSNITTFSASAETSVNLLSRVLDVCGSEFHLLAVVNTNFTQPVPIPKKVYYVFLNKVVDLGVVEL